MGRVMAELTGSISLTILAEEMVLSLGRAGRGEPLDDRDIQTLAAGAALLRGVSADSPSIDPPSAPNSLDGPALVREVYRAAESRAVDEPIRAYLARAAEVVERIAGRRAPRKADRPFLEDLRQVFALLGRRTMARSTDLFEGWRRDPFPWINSEETVSSLTRL